MGHILTNEEMGVYPETSVDEVINAQFSWGLSCNDCNEQGFAYHLADMWKEGKSEEEIKEVFKKYHNQQK